MLFPLLVVVTNAAMNIGEHMSSVQVPAFHFVCVCVCVCVFVVCVSRCGITASYSNSIFN